MAKEVKANLRLAILYPLCRPARLYSNMNRRAVKSKLAVRGTQHNLAI